MAENQDGNPQTEEQIINPFADNQPAQEHKELGATDPVIEKKDEIIEEEKPTIVKPNEPDKTPTATPVPIQDRPEPLKFANEKSEKFFNALKEGKEDEVYQYLQDKRTLSAVEQMSPEDVLKLNLQYQNKDLTQEDINDLYSEKYNLPEAPVQALDESDEEFAERKAGYDKTAGKVQRKIEREAKAARAELQKINQELVLPDIPQNLPVQQSQEDLAKVAEAKENYRKSIDAGLNELTGYTAVYKDEDVEIPVSYGISAEEKAALKSTLENFDMDEYFGKRWANEDGSLNVARIAQDIHRLENSEKITEKLITEAGNKRYAEAIKEQKNIDFSGNRGHGNHALTSKEEEERMVATFFNS